MGIIKKGRTFYIWLTSYILVFIIPLVFSLFNYFYSVDIIKYESLFHKKTTLNQMKDLLDFRLFEIENITNQLIWDRQIRLYLKLEEENSEFRDSIEKKIKELRFLNPYIDQIYIVNEKREKTSGERIIPDNYQAAGIDWEKVSVNKGKAFSFDDVNRFSEGAELYFTTKFFMMSEDSSDYYLVVFIKPEMLEKSIRQIEWIEKGAGFILNSDGQILSSVVNIEIDSSLSSEAAAFPSNLPENDKYYEIERGGQIISVIKSDIMDWYYTIIVPDSVFYGKLKTFQEMVLILLAICLTAGIFLSLFFARKNYVPISELVNLFSQKNFRKIYENYINEFEMLENGIKSVIDENISIKETFLKNKNNLKMVFLRRLIMGEEIGEALAADIGDTFGVAFASEYFAVMIADLRQNDSLNFFRFKNELIRKQEALESKYSCYPLVYSGKNVLIINIGNSDYLQLKNILAEISSLIREGSDIDFLVTAGQIYDSLAGISLSYSEALRVLEYRTLLEEKEILLFSELKNLEKSRTFRYLSYLDDEYKIYNLLAAGNYDEAKTVMEGGINSIEENYLDIDILKLRLAGFQNILIEALNTILRSDRENLKNLVKKIMECKSFLQFRKTADLIFSELALLSPDRNVSDIALSAKKYIEKNYSSKNISGPGIAESLGVTTQYLSKIFKEVNDTGLLQYINICRIEEAKKILLEESDISVKDITKIVGYYNETTFIRNFKSLTGISPGKYREMITRKD